jgi:cytochrome c biogenesis protein CcmG/thiol:disulfide interchange protein DsbE|tara:strand:- start:158 stop:679 length:522 start_codon:yes stop_codon:yes gene_type:complete
MKKKTLLIIITIFVIFCFVVLLKGLSNSNTYVPDTKVGKQLLSFKAKKLFNNEEVISDELFFENKIYLLNIWASWCVPCRTEHPNLMQLSSNSSIRIIGLNYKDDLTNAKKFINQMGNPYSEIIIDKDGTISIDLGAYGIPETFIIDKNKKVLKKFVGPINDQSLKEIESLLK